MSSVPGSSSVLFAIGFRLDRLGVQDLSPSLSRGEAVPYFRTDDGQARRTTPDLPDRIQRCIRNEALAVSDNATGRALSHMLVGLMFGVAGMAGVMYLVPRPRLVLTTIERLILIAGLIPVLLLVLASHEAGHLIAGALARIRPTLFIVGPLKLERHREGWRIGLNRSLALYGGIAAGVPQGTEGLRHRILQLTAGGPGTSIVVGAAILMLVAQFGFTRADFLSGFSAIAFAWLFVFGAASSLIGVVTLVPGESGGFLTDGGRILRYVRGGPDVEADVALTSIIGASMGGQRPREWDSELVARSLSLPVTSGLGAAARLLAHLHALDRGDMAAARTHLAEALAHRAVLPKMSETALLLQAGCFKAAYEHDATAARALLRDAGEGVLMSPHVRPLVEGAIRVAEGRDDAAAALDEAEGHLPAAIDQGGAVMARDLIVELRKRTTLGRPAAGEHA